MAESAVLINIIGERKFTLSDEVSELLATKRYLLDVKTSQVTLELYTLTLVDYSTVEIYKTPTLTSSGTLMTGTSSPVAMDIYKNPIVSTTIVDGQTVELKGTQIFGTSPFSYGGGSNRIILDASTKYMLNILPLASNAVPLS